MDRGCNEECSRGRERTDRRANTRTKHGRVNGIRGRWQSGSREGGRVLGPGEELHLEAAAGDEARHGVGAEPARNTPHRSVAHIANSDCDCRTRHERGCARHVRGMAHMLGQSARKKAMVECRTLQCRQQIRQIRQQTNTCAVGTKGSTVPALRQTQHPRRPVPRIPHSKRNMLTYRHSQTHTVPPTPQTHPTNTPQNPTRQRHGARGFGTRGPRPSPRRWQSRS